MKTTRLNQALFFLIFISVFALSFAYISEYFFGLQPCNLCLIERKPFFTIIAFCTLILVFFKTPSPKKIAIFFSLFLLTFNAAIAIYHVGVEQKIFKLSASCTPQSPLEYDSIDDLKAALLKEKIARCDEPSFFFLGLSMAAWNIFYCLGAAFLVGWFFRKKKRFF